MEHPPLSIAARLRPIVSHSALLLLGASWLLAVHLTFPKGGLRLPAHVRETFAEDADL